MSTFREVMNQLVAAIKGKNPNVSGRLTFQQMVDAVGSIPTGSVTNGAFFKCTATNGVTWNGIEMLQDSAGNWSEGQKVAADMTIAGYTPQVGEIYSSDTTIWCKDMFVATEGRMVCLVHFETQDRTFVDATGTCIVQIQPQADSGVIPHVSDTYTYGRVPAKFGDCSFYYNYYQPYYPNGGITIIDLPELDAFTIEFWHHHRGSNTSPFTGPCLVMPERGTKPRVEIPGYQFDSATYKGKWIHRAWVRGTGSNIIREYWDGVEVAQHECAAVFGGDRTLYVFGGGVVGVNTQDQLDELAIFNFAKYTGATYTVPVKAYTDIPSGIHQENPTRAVSVSGCSITFANDKSYDFVDNSATGINRVLKTADGKWMIYFSNEYYSWVVATTDDQYADGYIVAACIDTSAVEDPMNEEPIGNAHWIDDITKQPITVTAN